MTVNRYTKGSLAAAVLAAVMMSAPMGAMAADTAPMAPGTQAEQQTMERLTWFGMKEELRGVSVSRSWLRQARLNGLFINLRLHTPMGDEVTFRELLRDASDGSGMLCLCLLAQGDGDVITLQADQPAMDTLKRLGITEIVVADADRYVRAHYKTAELQAVRDALGLGAAEQLCVSGEDAPVTVVSEDGVRRQVN